MAQVHTSIKAQRRAYPEVMGNAATKQADEADQPSGFGQPVPDSYTTDVPASNERAPALQAGEPESVTDDEHTTAMLELVAWRRHQGMSRYDELYALPQNIREAREVYYPAVIRLRISEQSRVKAANKATYEAPESASTPLSELHGESAESQHPTVTNTNGARSVPAAGLTTASRQQSRDYR